MTSQQTASEALAIWQAHREEPRAVVSSLLDEFFNRVSADEFEDQLQCVRSEMSCPEITGSPSPLPSSAHSLLEC